MNCIDAIEGAAKSIITELLRIFNQNRLDDTEYAGNVKVVIDGVDGFICKNREILSDPQMLKQVLYEFSRDLWLANLEKNRDAATGSDEKQDAAEKVDENAFQNVVGKPTVTAVGNTIGTAAGNTIDTAVVNDRYDEYYFDYIYHHGEYPR